MEFVGKATIVSSGLIKYQNPAEENTWEDCFPFSTTDYSVEKAPGLELSKILNLVLWQMTVTRSTREYSVDYEKTWHEVHGALHMKQLSHFVGCASHFPCIISSGFHNSPMHYFHPHFIDEETELQKDPLT